MPSPLEAGVARRTTVFCGYCGEPPAPAAARAARVCERCQMGLLLCAAADAAPNAGEAFLVVDELLTIRAVSRDAERLLHQPETSLVSRQVGEVLAPAGVAPAAGSRLTALLASAARDGALVQEPIRAAVRPSDAYGVRFGIRIVGCRPGPAALLVFEEAL